MLGGIRPGLRQTLEPWIWIIKIILWEKNYIFLTKFIFFYCAQNFKIFISSDTALYYPSNGKCCSSKISKRSEVIPISEPFSDCCEGVVFKKNEKSCITSETGRKILIDYAPDYMFDWFYEEPRESILDRYNLGLEDWS